MNAMNIEENRLQTFGNWPADTIVNPIRIAKAGFFAVNQDLKVECFSCGLQISEWNYGDQIMTRHRRLSRSCPFVVDPIASGNISIITESNDTSITPQDVADASLNSHSLMHEAVRLKTFENWPVSHIVTPRSLARAGFYYLKQSDKTKCAFCNGVVVAWEIGDDPDKEHKQHFPECRFVQTVINPRLEGVVSSKRDNVPSFSNLNIVREDSSLQSLGVHAHKSPKRVKYATLESRLRTFVDWPDNLIQTPNALTEAGFYYEGSGDQVRCFHCDGGLRHWDPEDDPWTEHARWFPKCAYVLLVKGQDFVTACSIESLTSSMEESTTSTKLIERPDISEREIQAQMLTPPVIAALNIGLHVGRIKQAIKEKLEHTGTGFTTADEVIEAALNLQRDEDDVSDNHLSESISRFLAGIQESLNMLEGTPSGLVQDREHRQNSIENKTVNANCESNMNLNSKIISKTKLKTKAEKGFKKPLTLEEENRLLKEARLCKICMDVEVGIVFLPCGHLATCVNCAPNLLDCPVCRSIIKATVRTFLS